MRSLMKLYLRARMRSDLKQIISTPEGSRFFKYMLIECNVTRPVFYADNERLREAEGRRRFATSLLMLLGQDDPQQLINEIEQQGNPYDDTTSHTII